MAIEDCWTCEVPKTFTDDEAEYMKTVSGISEAKTTNRPNKRLRSTFCIEAIQTRSIARPLCDSRASCTLSYLKFAVRNPSAHILLFKADIHGSPVGSLMYRCCSRPIRSKLSTRSISHWRCASSLMAAYSLTKDCGFSDA